MVASSRDIIKSKGSEIMTYFLTDDTPLASYLYLKGETIMEGTLENPNHKKRRLFIFQKTRDLMQNRQDFYDRVTTVEPLEYMESRRHISRYLKVTVRDADKYLNDTINTEV